MASTATTDNGGGIAKPTKKICVIFLSFVAALALASIANFIVAHVLVVSEMLLSRSRVVVTEAPVADQDSVPIEPSKEPPRKKKKQKKKKKTASPPPRLETKTVYVAPTEEDLARLERELEASDPLPPPPPGDDASSAEARANAVIAATEALLAERDRRRDRARREVEALAAARAALATGLERAASSRGPAATARAAAAPWEARLASLRRVLGRTSLKDLSRRELSEVYAAAVDDVRWMLASGDPSDDEREALFYNFNNTLLLALVGEGAADGEPTTPGACHPSFLALDEGAPTTEFTLPPSPRELVASTAPPINNETAREFQLKDMIERVKNELSRRGLLGLEPGQDVPLAAEGADRIRAQLAPMSRALADRREAELALEAQVRDYWAGRVAALLAEPIAGADDRGGQGHAACATPDLVEALVSGGLEALRGRFDLRAALVRAASAAAADGSATVPGAADDMERSVEESVEEALVALREEEGGGGNAAPPGGTSSWTPGRKSIAYAVDGPLLRRGIAGWIDALSDAVAGHNDQLDMLADWVTGEEGSVGTSAVDAFLKAVRKVPFPEEEAERFKKAGILAGRMRSLLDK